MAKKKTKASSDNSPKSSLQDNLSSGTSSFTKGLVTDYDENFGADSTWVYARNAVNNSIEGDVGLLGNETANYKCAQAPYTIMGRIHLYKQFWAIMSTDETNSEIGVYDEDLCLYRTVVNASCLNFSVTHLITGVSKQNFDCSWAVYFADGKNPDRIINIGNPDLWPTGTYTGNNFYNFNQLWPGVAWNKQCTDENGVILPGPNDYVPVGCITCTDINTLNCEQIRINSLVKTPCVKLNAGATGGNISNGSYMAVIAYTINGQKYGDYTAPSNVQYIFNHNNIGGSLEVTISNLESESFSEFDLVLVSIINQVTVARKIGNYSTANGSTTVFIDTIDEGSPNIGLDLITIRTPLYETSESIFTVSNYLVRNAPRTTFDFNYQPLANQIDTEWVVSRYPVDYYKKGGYVTGYMRDEVYSFFIRWVYNTGEKSNSYHIPGRLSNPGELDTAVGHQDSIYADAPYERVFEVVNTASFISTLPSTPVEDGGEAIARGKMAYWESTEKYPDRNPEVWNSSFDPLLSGVLGTNYDLCGKAIRHHKMPEDVINNTATYSRTTTSGNTTPTHINILGVQFSNIKPPVYKTETGEVKVIPGIVGYEILRGSRDSNKTVIAKGIINNMRKYPDPTNTSESVLYQNFPYNPVKNLHAGGANGVLDPTLSTTPVAANGDNYGLVTEQQVSNDFFTFHSPDTSFYRPYLLTKELKLYTELGAVGNVTGQFQEVPGHPKEKLLTDFAFIVSTLIGLAEAVLTIGGQKTTSGESSRILNIGYVGVDAAVATSIAKAPTAAGVTPATTLTALAGIEGGQAIGNLVGDLLGTETLNSITNLIEPGSSLYNLYLPMTAFPGILGPSKQISSQASGFDLLPSALKTVGGVISFLSLTGTAMSNNIDLIYSLVKWRQYAVRYVSHGYLHKDNVGNAVAGNKRKYIQDAGYLTNNYDIFQNTKINNIYRSGTVVMKITENSSLLPGSINSPLLVDNTINSIGQNNGLGPSQNNPFPQFNTTASCYYAGIKVRFRNQYGQLDSIIQLPTSCSTVVNNGNPINNTAITQLESVTVFNTTYSSPVVFGGDTYISRYTEKNTFFYFNEWLYNVPDGTEFNYGDHFLGLYPRFWADFTKYDTEGFLTSILGNLATPSQWEVPSNTNNLDATSVNTSTGIGAVLEGLTQLRFGKKPGYFYLFQSGVRDFYVESEINVDQRDWGELDEEKHYPILSSLFDLFDTRIIKAGNYFKIDPSVSISRLFSNVTSWGTVQSRYYNPLVSELCYQYLSTRLVYSLPANLEQVKDYWRVFLPNNYRDFISPVTAIMPIGKNGALILFNHDSPVTFQGTETLETDMGTKLTIGDGALFSQPVQSIVNTDISYEYGSCQDVFSIVNSPSGLYYISQNQGKIFAISEGLTEVSAVGKRWWFSKFLPLRILVDFPDFELTNNPVAGVGCQTVYDNDFQLLYFCKKDYELRRDLPKGTSVAYQGGRTFLVNNSTKIVLGDPAYFKDVSWTVSFDPKSKAWISYHDWHPDMVIHSKLNFITTKGNGMWRHNDTTANYCNYYGVDYPFEIEYVQDTGQTVNSLKSIEYLLESYVYDQDGIDRFQVLDFNFDELVIYNTEQVSGLLRLNMAPKDDPFSRLQYPKVNPDSIDIAFEKVEQKFRINQFWDVTDDRGEYNPNVQRPIWLTEWDGYTRQLNPANLNYNKSVFERKKFRHYFANVLFIRKVSGNVKMLMKIANNKNLNSPR